MDRGFKLYTTEILINQPIQSFKLWIVSQNCILKEKKKSRLSDRTQRNRYRGNQKKIHLPHLSLFKIILEYSK